MRSAETVFGELSDIVFGCLRRSDQRRRGTEYLRGLLATPGRKTARNMAAAIGGRGTGQSLRHFISSSTWDWTAARRALARHVAATVPAYALVVRPMTIPKVGEHSVGVGRYFSALEGQLVNAQRAVGLWAADEQLSIPLNWRLHLPEPWRSDGELRVEADIPAGVDTRTPEDCVVAVCGEVRAGWGLSSRPVVVDARDLDPLAVVEGLRALGARSAVRVDPDQTLTVTDPALAGCATSMTAGDVMLAARHLRRPVLRSERRAGPARCTALLAGVDVATGTADPVRARQLRLVGLWERSRPAPSELWLTDLAAPHPGTMLHLSRLARRVEHDVTAIADQVGMRDYAGRSYGGWHRHVTLASVAHAVVALSEAVEDSRLAADPGTPLELAS